MPCIVASMAKKTKTPAAKTAGGSIDATRRLAECRRALNRCKTWEALHAELVELVDHADDLDTFGICESSAAGWACAARWTHKAKDVRKFDDRLKLAANRFPLAMDGSPGWNTFGITDVRKRMRGEAPHFTTATAAVAIALVIQAVAVLWKVDLQLIAGCTTHTTDTRQPSPLEAAILRVLLEDGKSLSADEIAPKVQRKIHRTITAKAVRAAVGKLRHDCGFPNLKATDAGYKLSPEDRVVAERIAPR